MFTPTLEVITGPMFAGKSDELIRRLTLCRHAKFNVMAFKPVIDKRTDESVCSRNGCAMNAVTVRDAWLILNLVTPEVQVIGIDEIQFFDDELVGVVRRLIRDKKRVICSGLNLDFREEPFENTMRLMALASCVTVLKAVCDECRSFEAVRSQRIHGGHERIEVGDEQYSPRCLRCYRVPEPAS